MVSIAAARSLPRANCHPERSEGSLLIDSERSLVALGMTEGCVPRASRQVLCTFLSMRFTVELSATAVHAPARESREPREEWASIQAGQRFPAILARTCILFRRAHEPHEAHEESAPVPMASASEAIPHEQGFSGCAWRSEKWSLDCARDDGGLVGQGVRRRMREEMRKIPAPSTPEGRSRTSCCRWPTSPARPG